MLAWSSIWASFVAVISHSAAVTLYYKSIYTINYMIAAIQAFAG